jgi:hypothetical protein
MLLKPFLFLQGLSGTGDGVAHGALHFLMADDGVLKPGRRNVSRVYIGKVELQALNGRPVFLIFVGDVRLLHFLYRYHANALCEHS